jgi:hypothetical protein
LLKCSVALALSAFDASLASLLALVVALKGAEMLEIVGETASLPSGLLSDSIFCWSTSRISSGMKGPNPQASKYTAIATNFDLVGASGNESNILTTILLIVSARDFWIKNIY